MAMRGVQMVDQTEARMQRRVVDAVAEIVGRDIADELAEDVYGAPPPAQQLTPDELALLARAEEENGLIR